MVPTKVHQSLNLLPSNTSERNFDSGTLLYQTGQDVSGSTKWFSTAKNVEVSVQNDGVWLQADVLNYEKEYVSSKINLSINIGNNYGILEQVEQ